MSYCLSGKRSTNTQVIHTPWDKRHQDLVAFDQRALLSTDISNYDMIHSNGSQPLLFCKIESFLYCPNFLLCSMLHRFYKFYILQVLSPPALLIPSITIFFLFLNISVVL